MSKSINFVAVLLAATCTINTAKADETILTDYVDSCDNAVVAGFEMLLIRPKRHGGTVSDNVFDDEFAARFMLGYETARGAGIRLEYFSFDHAETVGNGPAGNPSAIDTYNLDAGIYKRFGLGANNKLEFSGGLRYNNYRDQNWARTGAPFGISAWGGYLGIQAWQNLGWDTNAYVRVKHAILQGNANSNGPKRYDTTVTQQELAVGLQHTVSVGGVEAMLHGGLEFQDYQGYGLDAAPLPQQNQATGFGGWAGGLTVKY